MKDWEKLRSVVDKIFDKTQTERKKMNTALEQFTGKIWKDKELKEHDSRAFINYLFSTVQSIAPMLTDNPPMWTVIPMVPHLAKMGQVYNNALKYTWNILDMDKKVLLCCLDALLMKVGIFKVYYDYEKDKIAIDVTDPRTFFLTPGYDDLEEAPYCGTKKLVPLDLIKRKFNTSKVVPDESYFGEDGRDRFKFGESYDFEHTVRFSWLYEVYMQGNTDLGDIVETYNEEGKTKRRNVKTPNGRWLYFTRKTFLGEMRNDIDVGFPPFIPLYDYPVPHNFLGISEHDQIEGLNLELNLQLQAIMNYVRKYADPNIEIDINAYSEDPDTIQEKWEKGGQVFSVDGSMSQRQRTIQPVQQPELNPTIFQFFGILPKIIEEMTHVTETSKGIAAKKERQSASELAILYESSHVPTRQRVRNLEWTLKKVAYHWVKLMQQYYVKPRAIHTKFEGEPVVDYISNTRSFAEGVVGGKTQQEQKDYKKLVEAVDKEADPVFFPFDIAIDTNSTLPLDKQSLANMMIRLFQLGAVDRKALLETLSIPRAEEIVQRMEEAEQGEARKAGPPQGPGNPEDIREFTGLAQGG